MTQHRQPFHPAKSRGFTLIEVMITVAIIGILAAIAIPAYTDYVIRGQLSSAATGLSTMKAQMEQYFQNNRGYGPVGTGAGAPRPPCDPATPIAARTFEKFVVSCPAVPATGAVAYLLTAEGETGSAVAGFTFRINELDVRSTTYSGTRAGYGSCATKWLMKKGDTCP